MTERRIKEFPEIVNIGTDDWLLVDHTATNTTNKISFAHLGGVQGMQGPQGLRGYQGAQGKVGAQGNQGNQGNQGLRGFQGLRGVQGFQGLRGVQGFQGLQGFQGNQGKVGFQGTQGLQGFQGLRGVQGFQGFQGLQGFQGDAGTDGVQGFQGFQGKLGPQAVGNVTKVGTPVDNQVGVWTGDGTIEGTTDLTFNGTNLVLNGSDAFIDLAPTQSEGSAQVLVGINRTSNGDAAIKLTNQNGEPGVQLRRQDDDGANSATDLLHSGTGDLTIWSESTGDIVFRSNSVDQVRMDGSTGVLSFTEQIVGPSAAPTSDYQLANKKYVDDAALTGPQGFQGLTGDAGNDGLQGFQGIAGTDGVQGFQGTEGTDGIQGFQGIAGTDGLQGFQGTAGTDGLQGFQGKIGPQADLNNVTADMVQMDEIGTATYDDVQDWSNSTQSAGVISGGDISDSGSGEIDISTVKGVIKTTNSAIGANKFFDLAGVTNQSLTDNSTNYIAVDYNSGTPQFVIGTSNTANGHTIFNLGKVYREGTSLDIIGSGLHIYDFQKRIQQHHVEKDTLEFVSGAIVGETGIRNITITAGVMYAGINRIATDAIDTSGTDDFEFYYYNGAAWVESDETQINNSQYNNVATGLVTLTANRYGVQWVYKGTNSTTYVVCGQGDYTLAQAQAAQPPSSLPDHVSGFGVLRAKIIIQKSASSFTEIESVEDTSFTASTPSNHNELSGLQGGAADEYYHLTAAQYAAGGVQGFQGDAGVQGFQGIVGSDGVQGFQGIVGSDGVQGFQGEVGPQGSDSVGGLAWEVVTSNDTIGVNEGFIIDASSNTVDITLPATPSEGDSIGIKAIDDTYAITLLRNGSNIEGTADDLVWDVDGAGATLVYSDSTVGWTIVTEISSTPGTDGAQGFQGIAGTDGLQGFQGDAGTDGTQGFQGFQGNIGPQASGGGDVSKVGTPVDSQIGVWTGDGTIEGADSLTYDGSELYALGTFWLDKSSETGNADFITMEHADETWVLQVDSVGDLKIRDLSGNNNIVQISKSAVDDAINIGDTRLHLNNGAADYDVCIKGDTDTDLLCTDASTDRVGIGTGTPSEKLDVVGNAEINGNIIVTGTVDGVDLAKFQGGGISDLQNSEVSITGATTATISRMHIVTGTTAAYTVTLPAVSGNTGKFIGFRFSNALTVHVTLDGNGTEKIWSGHGEDLTRVYVGGEECVLYCDGTRWQVVHETLAELAFAAYQTGSTQSITNNATTVVQINTVIFDTHSCYDNTTNYRYTPTAPGIYSVTGSASLNNMVDGKEIWNAVSKNGSDTVWLQSFAIGADTVYGNMANGTTLFSMNGTTDYIDCRVWNGDTVARPTIVSGGLESRIMAHRICREES